VESNPGVVEPLIVLDTLVADVYAPPFYVISLLCSVRRTEVQVTARELSCLFSFFLFLWKAFHLQGCALDFLSEEA
jgi:hypothetical protein